VCYRVRVRVRAYSHCAQAAGSAPPSTATGAPQMVPLASLPSGVGSIAAGSRAPPSVESGSHGMSADSGESQPASRCSSTRGHAQCICASTHAQCHQPLAGAHRRLVTPHRSPTGRCCDPVIVAPCSPLSSACPRLGPPRCLDQTCACAGSTSRPSSGGGGDGGGGGSSSARRRRLDAARSYASMHTDPRQRSYPRAPPAPAPDEPRTGPQGQS
jgi:hypothetical protein